MAVNKKGGSGGRKGKIAPRPSRLNDPVQPTAIVNKAIPSNLAALGPRVPPIMDRQNCGSVGEARYSWCAVNQGATIILANSVCTVNAETGIRALTATDDIVTNPLLLNTPNDIAVGAQTKIYQFGSFRLDLSIVFLVGDHLFADPTTGALAHQSVSNTVRVAEVIDLDYLKR